MTSILNSIIQFFRSLLFSKHLEICVVGLQSAGKTSLVNLLSLGQFSTEMVPTIGFNMRKVSSGNTTIKVWDIGGQPRFRNMWERYCRGVSAVVFVVDSALPLPSDNGDGADGISKEASTGAGDSGGADSGPTSMHLHNPWVIATDELHALISRPQLAGIPLLVLATKNDVASAAHVDDVIRVMRLDTITGREVSCYSISSKNQVNIDVTLRWLCARSPLSQR
ncbi:P-loop containing nucleoside triphosphate hydrolase protein [Tilletiaria anomala UBC 951]|uniref:p-loop containing nucleoside triphosphate hydrolase protein n=1 Tax=Tilletiaria anomala (strain ATCC 24038 / CBS 436.72 / UBC 951) TaxID=1037660 RepID=A0A066VQA7_TILAU|nr:P-loop containing nucleoside triphosphate hydrolase protein [Tilletiaria anomala UBC 951]KDN40969.1 P-loop containing nucleoside triphosphate hydrolase protein [Tilletiaria anomala UBC 951]